MYLQVRNNNNGEQLGWVHLHPYLMDPSMVQVDVRAALEWRRKRTVRWCHSESRIIHILLKLTYYWTLSTDTEELRTLNLPFSSKCLLHDAYSPTKKSTWQVVWPAAESRIFPFVFVSGQLFSTTRLVSNVWLWLIVILRNATIPIQVTLITSINLTHSSD